jgi:membrane protease YdiL (CAAX protease family)
MMDKLKKLSIIGLACVLLSITITGLAGAAEPYGLPDEGVLFGIGALTCGIVAVIWIVWLVLAIWVYKDAEKRGMSGILWALIVFFLGIIGLIIYLVIRSSNKGLTPQQGAGSGRMCPNCGRPIPMDAQVCPYCGKNFKQ